MTTAITRGWELTKQSFTVLRENKKLLIFPFISTLACLLLISIFISPLIHLQTQQWQLGHSLYQKDALLLLLILVTFFLCNTVIIFCHSALIAATISYFKNEPIRLTTAIKSAWACFPQAMVWILFNTTIGGLLRFFQTRFNTITILASALAGTTWTVVSYFVVPVLVIEKINPWQAIKRSTHILGETWGPSLVSNLGIGILSLGSRLLALVPLILGFYIGHPSSILIGSLLSAVLFFLLHMFYSAIRNVSRCALYRYAVEQSIPIPFDENNLKQAFRSKNI